MTSPRAIRLLPWAGIVLLAAAGCGAEDQPGGAPAPPSGPPAAAAGQVDPTVTSLRSLLLWGETSGEMARYLVKAGELSAEHAGQVRRGEWDALLRGLCEREVEAKLAHSDVYWTLRSTAASAMSRRGEARKAARRALTLCAGRAHATYHAWRRARRLGEEPDAATRDVVLGVVCEIGYPAGLVLVAGWADGGASLYFGSGGGIVGGGAHEPVQQAARALVDTGQGFLGRLEPATEGHPLPATGQVRFTLLTPGGAHCGAVPKLPLDTAVHPLTRLYAATHDLITQLRLIDQAREKGR